MKDELEKILFDKYPKIFQQKDFPPSKTLMCFGIEHGAGWFDIIDALCRSIQWRVDEELRYQKLMRDELNSFWSIFKDYKHSWWWKNLSNRVNQYLKYRMPFEKWLENHNPQVVAVQVKEKFGGLRFYTAGHSDEIQGMIHMAEQWASQTCEKCGNPGKLRGQGWLYTACDECDEKRNSWEKCGGK